MILKFFRRLLLPTPQSGETWYYKGSKRNPWESQVVKVYVIAVKDGWVAHTSPFSYTAAQGRREPVQYEDHFSKINDFKDTYNAGPWKEETK